MFSRKIYLIFIFLLISNSVSTLTGQETKVMLRGVVKDESTGEGIPFVSVRVLETKLGTNSNSNGLFMIKGIFAGKYKIQITAIGYVKKIAEVDLTNPDEDIRVFKLTPSPIQMSTVVKEEDRINSEYRTNISIHKITAEELKLIPLPVEKDIFRSLKTVPGISTSSDVSGQFFVRGGAGDQNLVLYDNMVIFNPFHAMGIFSIFDGNNIKSYELETGGFDPEYGGRLSSVLNITSKDGNRNNYTGNLNLGMLALHGGVNGPLPWGTASFSFRKSIFDDILKKFVSHDVPLSFYDLTGKATIDFTESGKISFDIFKSNDKISNKTESDPKYFWDNNAYSINFQSFLKQLLITTSYSYSNYQINMDYNRPIYGANAESSLNNSLFNFKAEYLFDNNDILSSGMSFYSLSTEYHSLNDYNIPIMFYNDLVDKSFWMRYLFSGIPNMVIEPGVRYTITEVGFSYRHSLEPRLNLKYKLSDDISLKASFTRMHQSMISIQNEDDVIPLFEAWVPITEVYHPERADQYVFGIDSRINENYNLILQGYLKKISNYVSYNLEKTNSEEASLIPGTGESKGIEVYLKFGYDKIYGWLTYNLNWSDKISNGFKYAPRYDKRHTISSVIGIKLPYYINMGIVWEYSSGMPFTPIKAIFYNPISDNYFGAPEYGGRDYHFRMGSKNSYRLPSYHKMDINFTRAFVFDHFPEVELSFDITNLYNHSNIFYFDKNTGSRVDMLPFFVTMSIGVAI